MSSIPAPAPSLSLMMRLQRFPRAVAAFTVLLLLGGGALVIHSESQAQVLGMLAAFLVVFALADKSAAGREIAAICGDFSGFGNTVAMIGALTIAVVF